jgi:hypothetical protein
MRYIQEFKKLKSAEDRLKLSTRIIEVYPDFVPVIVDTERDDATAPVLTRRKFFCPREQTVANLMYILRNEHAKFDESQESLSWRLMVLTGKSSIGPQSSATMGHLHTHYADPDGFLYFVLAQEHAFGVSIDTTTPSRNISPSAHSF